MKTCPQCQLQYADEVDFCPADGMKLRATRIETEDPLIGRALDGRWVIEEKLGEGGMGAVYKGHQRSVSRTVAIKTLRPQLIDSEEFVDRFFREAKIAANISHPHCVTILDYGESDDGTLYLAMEFLEGELLTDRMETGDLTMKQVIKIGIQAASALSASHEQQIVHRDLKPDNIFLLDVPGGGIFIKVLDFGIAKMLDSKTQVTKTGMIFGTPEYMSPEQCKGGQIDGRSDLYSLGCILYELVGGRTPFKATTPMAVLMAHVNNDAPSLSVGETAAHVPSGLEQIIMRLLEKIPDYRFADAAELREALEAELHALENPSASVRGGRQIVAPEVNIGFDATMGITGNHDVEPRADRAAIETAPRPAPPARHGKLLITAAVVIFIGIGLAGAAALFLMKQDAVASAEPNITEESLAAANERDTPPAEDKQPVEVVDIVKTGQDSRGEGETAGSEPVATKSTDSEKMAAEDPPKKTAPKKTAPKKTAPKKIAPKKTDPPAKTTNTEPIEPSTKDEPKPKKKRRDPVKKINEKAEKFRDDVVKGTDKALENALDGLMGE